VTLGVEEMTQFSVQAKREIGVYAALAKSAGFQPN